MNQEQFQQMLQNKPAIAELWFQPLTDAMAERAINTPKRIAAFMAQALHESGSFRALEENLHYKPATLYRLFARHFRDYEECALYCQRGPEAIANRIYANRMGNGPEASGDGWRYRGSGIFQLTGHDQFERASRPLDQNGAGVNLLADPDLVRQPVEGAQVAAWFFWANRCNSFADRDNIDAISNIINTGSPTKHAIGQDERRALYHTCLNILDDEDAG